VRNSRREEQSCDGRRRFALRCARYEFVRSSHGTALIEYALLLGALACIVIAGVHFCDDQGIPVYRHLAGTLGSDVEPVLSEEELSDHVSEDLGRSGESNWRGKAYHAAAQPATAAFLAAALLIAVLWQITRRRRTRTESADEETAVDCTEDRLHAKRQILWKNVLDDPRLLFKNRVEVRHLMTRDVSVVASHTQTDELRRLMTEKHMHHALVCNSDGQLQGVVSDRDLMGETVESAARVMTPKPMTVRPDTTASAAIAMMLEHHISCLPVIHDDQICGILTRTDLLLSLQCMLQWWLRFSQSLARAAECSDKIDAVQETSGRFLFDQRVRLQTISQSLGPDGKPTKASDWQSFTAEAEAFLATAGELIAMQTFEGDRLSEMAGDLLEITKS
jgi:acetoin utilization protein AcuB